MRGQLEEIHTPRRESLSALATSALRPPTGCGVDNAVTVAKRSGYLRRGEPRQKRAEVVADRRVHSLRAAGADQRAESRQPIRTFGSPCGASVAHRREYPRWLGARQR